MTCFLAIFFLSACATSFGAVNARVSEACSLITPQSPSVSNFKSLTFYRLRASHSLHVYVGVNLVTLQADGSECAHNFTLGLTTSKDVREFERRMASGTACGDASEVYRYKDHDAAMKALSGAVAIHDATTYKQYHAAFYAGLLVTPLFGRPCANVVDEMTEFLARNPDS